MLDEEKIENASRICGSHFIGDNEDEAAQYGFKKGCKWALQEFKKSLWHDAEEMPERGKTFIFEIGSDDSVHHHVGAMYNPLDYEKNRKIWCMTKWCYIDDILPKKGDKE